MRFICNYLYFVYLNRPKRNKNAEHDFQNPIYESTTPSGLNPHGSQGPGYENVIMDDKNPAGATEHKFTVQPTIEGGPYYHVLEKPLPDHSTDTTQPGADRTELETADMLNGATAINA